MITKIEKAYLETVKKLASDFAEARSSQFLPTSKLKVYRSTYEVYMEIALFMYFRLGTASLDITDFNFNRIPCALLKKFSCKLYSKVIEDLEKNDLIRRNNHYNHTKYKNGKEQPRFCKSYLFSHKFQSKIHNLKYKFKTDLIEVEIPRKLERLIQEKMSLCQECCSQTKLNTYLEQTEKADVDHMQTIGDSKTNYYKDLKWNEDSLVKMCNGDEWKEIVLRRSLSRLKDDPIWKFGRWYHVFHRLSKECRETVLRLDGEKIKEVFDVSGSDMHMLAKHLEKYGMPVKELVKFQKDVMSDFIRKRFGTRRDGKCTARVKIAFKVYLNSKKSFYDSIRKGSLCSKIDDWFKLSYPTVREYIINNDDIWKDCMLGEFDVISKKMFKELQRRGIKAVTCHDAVYVKESEEVGDIKDLFYQCLELSAYVQDKLDRL